jgi:hypothetical protein
MQLATFSLLYGSVTSLPCLMTQIQAHSHYDVASLDSSLVDTYSASKLLSITLRSHSSTDDQPCHDLHGHYSDGDKDPDKPLIKGMVLGVSTITSELISRIWLF